MDEDDSKRNASASQETKTPAETEQESKQQLKKLDGGGEDILIQGPPDLHRQNVSRPGAEHVVPPTSTIADQVFSEDEDEAEAQDRSRNENVEEHHIVNATLVEEGAVSNETQQLPQEQYLSRGIMDAAEKPLVIAEALPEPSEENERNSLCCSGKKNRICLLFVVLLFIVTVVLASTISVVLLSEESGRKGKPSPNNDDNINTSEQKEDPSTDSESDEDESFSDEDESFSPTVAPPTFDMDAILATLPARMAHTLMMGASTTCGDGINPVENDFGSVTIACPFALRQILPAEGEETPTDPSVASCLRVSSSEISCRASTGNETSVSMVIWECAAEIFRDTLLEAQTTAELAVVRDCGNLLRVSTVRDLAYFGGSAHHYHSLGRFCEGQLSGAWDLWNSFPCSQGTPIFFPRPDDQQPPRSPSFSTQLYCAQWDACVASVDCGLAGCGNEPEIDFLSTCDVAVATVQTLDSDLGGNENCSYSAGEGPSLSTMTSLIEGKVEAAQFQVNSFVRNEIEDTVDDLLGGGGSSSSGGGSGGSSSGGFNGPSGGGGGGGKFIRKA